jgi:autophagy-related protein 27
LYKGDNELFYEGAYPIMRDYIHEGAHSDPKYTRLKASDSNTDSQKEGLRIEVGGGMREKQKQRAVIEFICQKDDKSKRDDEEKGDGDEDEDEDDRKHPDWEAAKKTDDGAGGIIEFQSYEDNTLRLNWYTQHGCEDAASSGDSQPSESSGGWGFFSWFFFIIFMLLLAYLAFTAWINYTRHGARGWELLPHSDTIRDVPYIIGDWGRRIVNTLGGSGTRGGYSAV